MVPKNCRIVELTLISLLQHVIFKLLHKNEHKLGKKDETPVLFGGEEEREGSLFPCSLATLSIEPEP